MEPLSLRPAPSDAIGCLHVLVIDDHDLVRLGIRTLLDACARAQGLDIRCHEAPSLARAVEVLRPFAARRHLVLLDLQLPDAHGLSGLQTLLKQFPAAAVVVLSGNNDPALMRQSLAAGALAFLRKADDMQAVVDFVCARAAGTTPAPPTAAPQPAAQRTVTTPEGLSVALSERQAAVLDAVLSGRSNRDIAEQLALAEGTVRNHISNLLLSFGVRSRSQLISMLR